MAKTNKGLKLIGVPVEPDLHEAVVRFAEENGEPGHPLPLAVVCRQLLRTVFTEKLDLLAAQDLQDAGYQAGLRRGLEESRQHMKKLYTGGGRK